MDQRPSWKSSSCPQERSDDHQIDTHPINDMKKLISLLLIPLILIPLSLSAQSKREATLKSLTVLYEKNKQEAHKEMVKLSEENADLSFENRRLIIELEDAKHQVGTKEVALKEAQARIKALEEEVTLLKQNPRGNQVRDVEVLAMARPSSLEPFGPNFSKGGSKSNQEPNAFNAPLTEGTLLLVNINSATEREIRMIPGVGGNLAKRIVENRPYESVYGLLKIDGVGRKRIEILSPYITVE